MIEMVRHIEKLLLENDCVVVPGFGGFITYYTPAVWSNEEDIFLPPTRSIGFNPQLKMNDGLLVQSYMNVYDTDFSDASKILQKEVDTLIDILHKEGTIELLNLGTISLSVYDSFIFSPYNDKISSPSLYGLDTLKIDNLKVLREKQVLQTVSQSSKKKNYEIRINRTFVRSTVAAVAAIFLFISLSTPIQNTYVEKINYAQLLPADLFNKIEQQSLLTSSVVLPVSKEASSANQSTTILEDIPEISHSEKVNGLIQDNQPETEIKALEEASAPDPLKNEKSEDAQLISGRYHLIVASVVKEKEAQVILSDLRDQGYLNAKAISSNGRIRISLMTYSTREEANSQLIELRKNDAYKSAWLFVK